jgi:hypothetical protein
MSLEGGEDNRQLSDGSVGIPLVHEGLIEKEESSGKSISQFQLGWR